MCSSVPERHGLSRPYQRSNTGANDGFGSSVLSGDLLAVGALGEASRATGTNGDRRTIVQADSGAVYGSGGGSSGTAVLYQSLKYRQDDRFGWTVAIVRRSLAVGAYV